ncbi:MAG: pantoate--beta-alanine ligase [Lentisphaeria bacterium]
MLVKQKVDDTQDRVRQWRMRGDTVALVPTMGYLHEGHLSLVRLAKEKADRVVVSIFVNPAQFGPQEDFAAYPRDFQRDEELCREAGVDMVFYPNADELYPNNYSTWVEETELSRLLCGAARPGHFRGVVTVVTKLFNICLPDIAVFGQKDAQQALVIKRMTRDLNFPIEIVVGPIIREPDGLAVSSRNSYLSESERKRALALSKGLTEAQKAFKKGQKEALMLRDKVKAELLTAKAEIDYVECVSRETLQPLTYVDEPALLAVAAYVGKVRLIDNCFLYIRMENFNHGYP